MDKPKMVVIVGPTSSGKSDLAVALAKKFNGEVISADSRQVYKGLNIGTGKITKKEMRGVKHHLLDVADPRKQFTVSDFLDLTNKTIVQIVKSGKLPIVCGGTGFYIDALLGEKQIPEVPPNPKLRKQLENKTTKELFKMLQKLDPERAKNIDAQNPRRLVRAIEIAKKLGKVPEYREPDFKYDVLKIGIAPLKKKAHPLAPSPKWRGDSSPKPSSCSL
jgi:tRNA dimethylallyltransferase